jgi:glycosyltransferase involved in cell wall biosynthesis
MRLIAGFFVPKGLRARLRGRPATPAAPTQAPTREEPGPLSQPFEERGNTPLTARPSPPPYRVKITAPDSPNRPRVLHAIANFMIGGSSRLVVDLIENLGGSYEQKVLTGFIPDPPAYLDLSIAEIRDVNSYGAVLQLIDEFQPDIVHVHYWGDSDESWYRQVFEAARASSRVIVQNVNTPVHPFPMRVAQNVFVSEYVHHVFADGNPGRVIYPGSNFTLFANHEGRQPVEDCIAMVYRLEQDKLNEAAIEPFIQIIQGRPATKALIVGGGSLLEGFKRRVEQEGLAASFEFTDYVPYHALPELYRRMSLFIAPVWQESFGQVTPFAMNMGIPVVGYAVGAIGEIIDDAQLTAPPGDAKALAQIAIALLNDKSRRQAIGERNRLRAEQLFSVHAMIDAYRSLYASVLPRKTA